jgi:AcrR family transcriptional regulator
MSASAAPRRRLTAEERRVGILDAALAVFSRRGYHAASIDDIAGEAGVSKALIYDHFESKQALYADLIGRNGHELTQRVGASIAAVEIPSAAARLAAGLDAFFAFVEERRDGWRMLFREASDPEAAAVLDRMVEQVTIEVQGLMAHDPDVRELWKAERGPELRLTAEMLVGGAQSMANWWTDHPDVSREHMVEVAMGFAWLGLDRLGAGQRWQQPE